MKMIKKTKRKINKLNLWAIIVSCIAIFAFVCIVIGICVVLFLLRDKPTLNLADFEQTESSVIYDQNGDEVANLGKVIRQNVEYDEIPNCVIDAFIAVEDSRFYEHNGFDIPRFTKAMIENIINLDFGQGGSTFTMQLVKNTYFTNDDTGEQASRSGASGIKRKVQEIALAIELEHYEPKQFIFESYVNKLNFGGDRNIRGIQKAAQYYFGKDINQVNINEAALLAGVINAPNYYNPYYNIEAAQDREETVLYLMYYHGYISKQEYELALTVKVEDLLYDSYGSNKDGEGIPYQAYVDTVVSEVLDLTGIDPYTTTMHIYTYMNKDIQATMDSIQAGNVYLDEDDEESYIQYPDDYMECASVCIDNSTGQIVGILGGRNYAGGGQLLLNHATEQYKQPGSSIKPILDYALAFENLGWATDHVLTDAPQYMDSAKTNLVYNFSGNYVGDVTLKQAVGDSINTCAIQTLQAVLDKMKYEYVVNYCQSLGYEFTLDNFNVQYGVGGSTCEVTPLQHAAAYAAIMNYGVYNEPHTVKRIEFTNGKSPITPVYESKQVISEAAAYLTTELMKSNIDNYGGSYSFVKSSDYQVYAKTGTTDWGSEGAQYGIPSGSNKDCWLVASTSEYTTATWIGYEKAVLGQPSYVTNDVYYNVRPQARIAHTILESCYQYGDETSVLSKPSGVTSITHILGTWPYASTNISGVNLDESLITTGLIKSDSVKLVSLSAPSISASPSGCKASVSGESTNSALLSITWSAYPDSNATEVVGDTRKQDLVSPTGEVIVESTGKVLFDYSWIYGPVKYYADITVKPVTGDTRTYTVKSSDTHATQSIGNIMDGADIHVSCYYKYENTDAKSSTDDFKVNVEEQDLTFKVPSSNSSSKYVKEWCDKNGFSFEEKTEDSSHAAGTFVVSSSSKTYTYDQEDTIKKSTASSISCVYYTEKTAYSITFGSGKSGDNFSITAHLESGDSLTDNGWSYSGGTYVGTTSDEAARTSTITFEYLEDAEVTVTYTSKKTSKSTTIKMSED